jgi:multiple sugar transport system permease protein
MLKLFEPRIAPKTVVINLVLLIFSLVMALPFLWMLMASIAPQGEIFSGSLFITPSFEAAKQNYAFAFSRSPLLRYMANGFLVCAIIIVVQVSFAAPAGYALAKLNFRGRSILFGASVISLMIPIQVPAIPLYIVLAYAGLLDTYTALVLPFIVSGFAIFLFRQFFSSYSDEIIDAARIDGFSELSIVWSLMLPAAWPAVAAFSIFSFVANWNDLYWPLVVITEPTMMTPALGIATFRASGDSAGNVGALMASGLVITLPLVVIFSIIQKQFIRSMAGPQAFALASKTP